MNRTALSVIALAVGSVLIIGLFNIYKPAVSHVAHDVFSKVHIGGLSHPTTHHYAGLTYTDDGIGNIEFTTGKLHSGHAGWYNGFVKFAPKDIQHAKNIKFDNVDVYKSEELYGMFDYDPYVRSIDFGDNFDTSHSGLASMFDHDPQLRSVHFGKKFATQPGDNLEVGNMLSSDPKLQLSGNIPPEVQRAYNANHNSMFDMDRVVDGKPLKDFL